MTLVTAQFGNFGSYFVDYRLYFFMWRTLSSSSSSSFLFTPKKKAWRFFYWFSVCVSDPLYYFYTMLEKEATSTKNKRKYDNQNWKQTKKTKIKKTNSYPTQQTTKRASSKSRGKMYKVMGLWFFCLIFCG